MTNKYRLTERRVAEILARAEICDDSVLTDYADIAAAMREIQEYRKASGKIRRFELDMSDCDSCGQDCGADMVEDIDGEYVLLEEVIPYLYQHAEYTPLPAPAVVPDGLRMALSNAGIAAPESDEMLFATHEKYLQLLVNWVRERKPFQPDPAVEVRSIALFDGDISPADAEKLTAAIRELNKAPSEPARLAAVEAVPDIDALRLIFESTERASDDGFNLHKYGIGYADESTQGRWQSWLACRAAMLNHSGGATEKGNSPAIPDSWCHTCRPVTITNMRFVVCPNCGNKRCPHANDHRNVCTGSNEPGQEGSAYPAAPQQEVK